MLSSVFILGEIWESSGLGLKSHVRAVFAFLPRALLPDLGRNEPVHRRTLQLILDPGAVREAVHRR
jgi:hypothetical protein